MPLRVVRVLVIHILHKEGRELGVGHKAARAAIDRAKLKQPVAGRIVTP